MISETINYMFGAQVTAGKVAFLIYILVAAVVLMIIDWRAGRRMP